MNVPHLTPWWRIAAICLQTSMVQLFGAPMALDISAAFNYDAIGTQKEIDWITQNYPSGDRTISDILGDHNLKLSNGSGNYCFTDTRSLTAGNAFPTTGVIGDFLVRFVHNKISGSAFLKVPNCVRISSASTGTITVASATISLSGYQRLKYDNLNLLFVQSRSNLSGIYRTRISVTYADDTSSVVYDTGAANVASNAPGGTLGSAGVNSQGGFGSSLDSNPSVSRVLNCTHHVRQIGSSGNSYSGVRSGSANLWQMAVPLSLNPAKDLKSISIQLETTGNGRFSEMLVFGLSASPHESISPPETDPSEYLQVTFNPSRLNTHPRLLLTPTTLPSIQSYYNSPAGAQWKSSLNSFVASCNPPYDFSLLTDGTDAQQYGMWRLPTLALHFLLTGDAKSLENAIKFLELFAAIPDWEITTERNSGMCAANIMLGTALAYDWLYNSLDPTFRETVRLKLIKQARALYYGGHLKGNSDISAVYWQLDPLNNHRWHRDAGLTLAALATYTGSISENWLVNRIVNELAMVANWLPEDGTSHESPSYLVFGGNHLMLAMQSGDECLGSDNLNRPFFTNVASARLRFLIASFGTTLSYGDWSASGHGDYNNFTFKAANHHNQPDVLAGLRAFATSRPSAFKFAWFSLLWDNTDIPSGDYTNLARDSYFPDIGVSTFRQSWTGGVSAMFKCSPLGGQSLNQFRNANGYTYVNVAHDDPDANSFLIYNGSEALAATDQYSSHKRSSQHNTVLVNGIGQFGKGRSEPQTYSQPGSGDMLPTAKIISRTTAGSATIVEGEAKGAYPSATVNGVSRPAIDRYRRLFVWKPSEYILVLDDLRAASSVTFTWLVQGPGITVIDSTNGIFRLESATKSCEFQVVGSLPLGYTLATSSADNRGTSLNYRQLQTSTTASALCLGSVFDPWARGSLRVAFQNITPTGMDVVVTGAGILDRYRWTFASSATAPSTLVLQ